MKAHEQAAPTRQEVHWVDESRTVVVSADRRPDRVWTLYLCSDKNVAPTLPWRPVHYDGAFLEDYVHDWHWSARTGVLRYFSRAIECNTWILCEWDEDAGQKTPRRSAAAEADR